MIACARYPKVASTREVVNMKPGRNDPCPCGSGKKYKKCCMVNERQISITSLALRRTANRVASPLLKHARKIYGPEAFFDAWEDFWSETFGDFEHHHPVLQLYTPWFLYHWYPDDSDPEVAFPHPDTVVSRYLKENGQKVDMLTRTFLEAASREPLTFWEAEEVEPDTGILFKDMVTGRACFVREVSGSKIIKKWDIIFGQVVGMDGEYILNASGPYPLTPARFREFVTEFADGVRKLKGPSIDPVELLEYDLDFIDCYQDCVDEILHPTLPELRNMDNEKLVFSKAHFSFRPEDRLAVLTKLRSMRNFEEGGEEEGKIEFAWTVAQKGKPLDNIIKGYIRVGKDFIETECNSKQRDVRLKKRLMSGIGEWIEYQDTSYTNIEDIEPEGHDPAEAQESGAVDLNALPEEARQQVIGILEQQYLGWADQKIPALNNRTPRQAVKREEGKKEVVALINDWENSQERMPNPQFRFDFNRLRRELGLEEG